MVEAADTLQISLSAAHARLAKARETLNAKTTRQCIAIATRLGYLR